MHARHRAVVPARRVPPWCRIGGPCVAAILVAALAGGCGTQQTPTPAPSASPAPTPVAPTATPAPAYADALRVGWGPQWYGINGFRAATEGGCCQGSAPKEIDLGSVVYSGLYRYDARFNALPDLADGACLPQADPKVIRCRIIETTFHDGTPLTADDVAYTYRLFSRPTFSGGPESPGSWIPSLEEARVVDPRTVDFVLGSVDPTFLTTVLPSVPILPRRAVEASYAAFVSATKSLKAADLTKLADEIDAGWDQETPVCSPRLDAAAVLLEKIGVTLYREDFSRSGEFDACAWVGNAGWFFRRAAAALGSTGLDAVAAAYICLSIDQHPIGTGPYRLVSAEANRTHLEAWPGYHGGLAATRYLDFVPAKGDGSDLVEGTIDIYQAADLGPAYQATTASNGVRVATPPQTGFYALAFNVRPGRLFADVNLRQALQLCIDLPRDVDAATGGTGTALYGPVLPGSWGDDPTLPRPPRDTATARARIEGAGWRLGADGFYEKDGVPLAAVIPVRSDDPPKVKMTDLIALQARECGMDLRSLPTTAEELKSTIFQYPHNVPGTNRPFDLFLVWWATEADPGPLGMFTSSTISDAKHPDAANFTGFSDPVVDRLLGVASSIYGQAERTRLYREVQQEFAAQLPYIFLWADNAYDVVRSAVATVDEPLDLTAPYWAWQPERMVVTAPGP